MTDWALVLDFDGVIVDSEVHWREVEHEFLKEILPDWSETDQDRILGMSVYDVHALLVRDYGLKLGRDEYIDYYRSLSRKIYGERSSLIPGITEIIRDAVTHKIPLGIATSSPRDWVFIALDRFDFRASIDSVSSSDDVHGVGKPAPDVYLHAAKQLGIAPKRCVAVEDTTKGIASAKDAGMVCVGIRNGFNDGQDLRRANLEVSSLRETSLADFARLMGADLSQKT